MKSRKIISILLALVMTASALGFYAFAADITEPVSVESGSVTVSGVSVQNSERAVNVYAEVEDVTLTVTGNVSLDNTEEETGDAIAVALFGEEGVATANITGNVSIKGGYYINGIRAYNAKATVGGNVTAEGENLSAIEAVADKKTDISVTGSVAATGFCATGLYLESFCDEEQNPAEVKVTVGNGITATGMEASDPSEDYDGYGSGIDLYRSAGNVTVEVTGDIVATNNGGYATAIYISNSYNHDEVMPETLGKNTIIVHGDLISDAYAIELSSPRLMDSAGGTTDILVEGTIDAKESGFYTYGSDGFFVIDVPGTPDGINPGETGEVEEPETGINLTVWKIKLNENGNAAEWEKQNVTDEPGETELETAAAENFEAGIQYIIRIEQPEEGGTIKAVDENGNDLLKSFDFDVAREGDKIYIDDSGLEDGYTLKAAFNGDEEKAELEKDENGKYYIVVPKGGGIDLSVELEKEEQDNPDNPDNSEVNIEIKDFKEQDESGYKEDKTFTADVSGMPEGAEIHWFVNGEDAGTGESITVEDPTEDYTVQAKVIDKDGNVLDESSTAKVKVRNGFFDKLEAFFLDLIEKILGKAIADFLSSIC